MAATFYFEYKPPELLLELHGVSAVLSAGFSLSCFCSIRLASAKP